MKKNKLLKVLSFLSIIISFFSLVLFLIYGIKLLNKGNVKYGCISIISAFVFIAIEIFLVFFDKAARKYNKIKKTIFSIVFKYSTALLKTIVIILSITEAGNNNPSGIDAMDIVWLIWIQMTLFIDIVLRIIIIIVKLIIFVIRKIMKKNKPDESQS